MTYIDNLDRLHARVIANVWLQLFTGIVRVLLAIGFILPGMTKVLGNRFTSLPVTTPVGSFFDAFFQAHEYYIFVGTAQVLAGILLLFRRTTTLGAVLYLPIILNIFVITVSIGFALTEMITGLMTLANVYLLCWDYDRWKGLLPVEASESRHVGMAVLFSLLIAAVSGFLGLTRLHLALLRQGTLILPITLMLAGAAVALGAVWRHLRLSSR
jgi:hypothetical protein